jgi:hypothetical protein
VPDGIGPAGRAFCRRIWAIYDLAPAEVALLARACRVIDLLARMDRQLAAEKLIVKGSTGQPRANPLLAASAEQARTLEGLVRAMCLPAPWESEGRGVARSSRPPRWNGGGGAMAPVGR